MTLRILYTGTRRPEAPAGARLTHAPMLDTEVRPVDESTVRDFCQSETNFVFYSANGVAALAETTRLLDELPAAVTLWAVGERTADALRQKTHTEVHSPSDQRFAGLVDELPPGRHVSFELAQGPRSLADERSEDDVLTVICYASVQLVDDARSELQAPIPDWIVFTSPRGFDAFCQHAVGEKWLDAAKTAAIGPTTAAAMAEAGYAPELVASTPDADALLGAIIDGQKEHREH